MLKSLKGPVPYKHAGYDAGARSDHSIVHIELWSARRRSAHGGLGTRATALRIFASCEDYVTLV